MLFVKFTVLTDIGKKRSLNEDRVIYLEHHSKVKLAVLADGMGGHNAGDVASEMAIQYFQEAFLNADESTFESTERTQNWLIEHVSMLNYNMYQHSLTHEQCQGMGTTLIVTVIRGTQLLISHVGDSRLYTFTNNAYKLITKDHTYVNMLLELGQINEEEAREHPRKNAIIKAVGTEPTIQPDFYEVKIEPPMYVLICTDGLSNKVSEGEIAAILTLPSPIETKGKSLIQLANDSGGEDNISLILMSFSEEEVSSC